MIVYTLKEETFAEETFAISRIFGKIAKVYSCEKSQRIHSRKFILAKYPNSGYSRKFIPAKIFFFTLVDFFRAWNQKYFLPIFLLYLT